MDNASSHRNEKIKRLVNENNHLLYSIPYQHYTNCIENFFSVIKNRLYKIKGIGYTQLSRNINNILKDIPLNIYKNIFKGTYERESKIKVKKHRRIKKKVYKNE